MQIMFSSERRT